MRRRQDTVKNFIKYEINLAASQNKVNFAAEIIDNWKDAGVVDRDGLENRCTLTGTQGSNPCLSAINPDYQVIKQIVPNFTPSFGREIGCFVWGLKGRKRRE